MEKLYTIAEVADKLNLSAKTLRRWEEAGRFTPSRTLGGQRRYSIEDLQILDALKHGTIPDQKDLLTLAQAAALFGVSPATVDRWENEGKIHPFITAGTTYYPRHRLMEKIGELQKEFIPEPPPPTPPRSVYMNVADQVTTSPAPMSAPPTPSHPSTTSTKGDRDHRTIILDALVINTAVTLVLLTGYYFLTRPLDVVSPAGSVQGVEAAKDPRVDDLIKKFQDFVAGQMQRDAAPAAPTVIDAKNTVLTAHTGVLPKGKNQISVSDPSLTPHTPVTATFTTDYSPAKKYWVTVQQGSFTLATDYPVAQDSTFSYFTVTPAESPEASASAAPAERSL